MARAGLKPALVPFTGPPVGVPFSDPAANPAKLAYFMVDAPRMTMRMGLPIVPPNPFEVDMTAAYKASVAAELEGKGFDFALAVSDARWGEGKNVSEMNVLRACAEKCGWSGDAVDAAQSAISVGKAMKAHRALIEEDGVFGVPFAVFNGEKFWGHDRFDLLLEKAARAA